MADVLRRGASGPEVERLQTMLRDLGYYGGAIDGDFGPRTETAVRAYQEQAGLRDDGVVGDHTWASLDGNGRDYVGLRGRESVDDYVSDAVGTMNSSMAPQDRLDALMDAALQELRDHGVPVPTYAFKASLAGSGTLAEFDSDNTWHIDVSPDKFDPAWVEQADQAELADVANTIYHESRHAEMTFREARLQAGLGNDAAQIVADMGIPQWVADAAYANPLTPQSDETREAEEALEGYESFYGSGAATTADVYANGTYDEYRQLPEEADAFETGRNVGNEWRNTWGIRGTIRRGDNSDDVGFLQRGLAHLGFYHGAIDNDFGPATEAAVEGFQGQYDLTADGVVGEKTWEMLARVYAE